MKRIPGFIGWIVIAMALAGALGIGDFRLYYGPNWLDFAADQAGCDVPQPMKKRPTT